MAAGEDAASVIARALAKKPPGQRKEMLVLIMHHAAAGLEVIEGRRKASEHVYRLADTLVERTPPR